VGLLVVAVIVVLVFVLPVIVVVGHGSGLLLAAAMGPETLGGHRRSVLD
jgi:hypothetical protein